MAALVIGTGFCTCQPFRGNAYCVTVFLSQVSLLVTSFLELAFQRKKWKNRLCPHFFLSLLLPRDKNWGMSIVSPVCQDEDGAEQAGGKQRVALLVETVRGKGVALGRPRLAL